MSQLNLNLEIDNLHELNAMLKELEMLLNKISNFQVRLKHSESSPPNHQE
jgi:hypothetical protein